MSGSVNMFLIRGHLLLIQLFCVVFRGKTPVIPPNTGSPHYTRAFFAQEVYLYAYAKYASFLPITFMPNHTM
jgi:hypothetical protein